MPKSRDALGTFTSKLEFQVFAEVANCIHDKRSQELSHSGKNQSTVE